MANFIFQLFFEFPVVLVAELTLVIYLSRRRVKHGLRWVLGSYLMFVAAALAFGLIARDEFGYGFIPLIVMTAPWQLLHLRLPQTFFTGDLVQIAFGLALNCAVLYLIGRLCFPRHPARLSDRHAT